MWLPGMFPIQMYTVGLSLRPSSLHALYFLGGSAFAFVTAAISWSTTLLPDLLPMPSISFTLTSVSFFASSSAFWLPELCCAIVSSLPSSGSPLDLHLLVKLLVLILLFLLIVLNLLLRLVSCVLYSLGAVCVGQTCGLVGAFECHVHSLAGYMLARTQ
jgi:hypothetical protein